ncbi:hypothetical protein HPB48_016102 [Haemaphysalis longicornis]|uniref:Tectonic-1-3 N-terminal domain-containing protein n=1 Tax=Haemaphysalis longicornis TaxID=44386 RepID=A0A9J6GXY7_HAELO|nr:hypothetical protein HPB48_016102 [Haemaphysalis longicornis]
MNGTVSFFILMCASNLLFPASANDTSTQVPTEAPNSTEMLETTTLGTLETTSQTALTSTVTQVTETPTSPPPTAPAPTLLVSPSDRCACDLTANSCDVNCCCDGDCTVEDAEAFHSCVDKVPENPDLRYCTKRDLVFSNRTLFEKRPVGDLLCIVVDNVKKKDVYGDPPTITTLAEAHSFVKDNPHAWRPMGSRWRELQVGFKAGSALLRVDDSGRVEEWSEFSKLG